jgi:hypothetical protein
MLHVNASHSSAPGVLLLSASVYPAGRLPEMSISFTRMAGCLFIKHGTLLIVVRMLVAMQMAIETYFTVDLRHALPVGYGHTAGTKDQVHFFECKSLGLGH